MQQETVVMYDGRLVPKAHFRVFIYNTKNEQKLVESWEEFVEHISSGLWFARKEDVPLHVGKVILQKHKGGK